MKRSVEEKIVLVIGYLTLMYLTLLGGVVAIRYLLNY